MAKATKQQGKAPYGESSREYRRTTYRTYEDWVDHRASFGVFEDLRGILFSGVIRQLATPILSVTLVSVSLVLWNGFIGNQSSVLAHPSLPATSSTLYLVEPSVRTAADFSDKYQLCALAGSKGKWSTVVTHGMDIALMATTFIDKNSAPAMEALDRLIRILGVLLRYVMNCFLEKSDDAAFEREVFELLEESEFADELLDAPDRTMAALLELSFRLDAILIDEKR